MGESKARGVRVEVMKVYPWGKNSGNGQAGRQASGKGSKCRRGKTEERRTYIRGEKCGIEGYGKEKTYKTFHYESVTRKSTQGHVEWHF